MTLLEMGSSWQEKDLGHAKVWTLDRPSARNALCRTARAELESLVSSLERAPEVRTVVITGAGDKAFCAGADLAERASMSEDDVRAWLEDLGRTFTAMERSPKVFTAAIDGIALGGGLELALACDIRVASRSAMLGLPETRLAIIPGGGGTQRLPRLIGPGRAKEMILTGRMVDAEEAYTIGLVERPPPVGRSALSEALDIAETLRGCGPLALAAAKAAVSEGMEQSLHDGLARERALYHTLLGTSDRLEGLEAFKGKRPPRYSGE